MRFYIILPGIILFLLQCAKPEIKSSPQKEPIFVDGLAYEWEKYPVEYNEDWHLVYGAVHSDSTLNLVFSFNDPQLARRMARRGVILWFDEDKKFGLKYSEPFAEEDFKFPNPNELYIPKGNFKAVGKDTVFAPDLTNYPAIKAKLGLDKGLYCFEFSFPLNPDSNLAFLKNAFSKKLRFGFELAGIRDEQREKKREDMDGRKPGGLSGGMGSGRSGRMGGPKGDGQGPKRALDFEGKEIWFDVIVKQ